MAWGQRNTIPESGRVPVVVVSDVYCAYDGEFYRRGDTALVGEGESRYMERVGSGAPPGSPEAEEAREGL